jgi:hypothetical protein
MTTSNPWAPPVAPDLALAEALYRQLHLALGICARGDVEIPIWAALVSLLDVAADLVVTSGTLWTTPDMVAAMRVVADELERRREHDPPEPLLATLKEALAAGRMKRAN